MCDVNWPLPAKNVITIHWFAFAAVSAYRSVVAGDMGLKKDLPTQTLFAKAMYGQIIMFVFLFQRIPTLIS